MDMDGNEHTTYAVTTNIQDQCTGVKSALN